MADYDSNGLIPDSGHRGYDSGHSSGYNSENVLDHRAQNGSTDYRPQTPPQEKNPFVHAHDPSHMKLLNTLTELQALKIESGLDLPQIVVCGSQSSGKSSVLEALTEIPFPRSGNTCTRFVTKVTIRPSRIDSVTVLIEREDPVRGHTEFSPITNLRNLSQELQKHFTDAERDILGNQKETKFSRDVLCINISGPNRPVLQILDLPGLISHDPSDIRNIDLVRNIVEAEMIKPQSTILAVVSANVDPKNQGILRLCGDNDPQGERTVGIITKPDEASSTAAQTYVEIAQGNSHEVSIRHDWHVIRNRNADELRRNTTIEQRNQAEDEYLAKHPWSPLGRENLGVKSLRTRLSKLLFDTASREFPKLAEKTKTQIGVLETKLKELGGDSLAEGEQRDIFDTRIGRLNSSTSLRALGVYEHDISELSPSHPIRLRARIVDQSELFRDRIILEGHLWEGGVSLSPKDPDADHKSIAREDPRSPMQKHIPEIWSREQEIAYAREHLNLARGMELPGTFEPRHINDFFWKQSREWNAIAKEHINKVHDHCERYFKHAVKLAFSPEHLIDPKPTFGNHEVVAGKVLRYVSEGLKQRRLQAEIELQKIEKDRTQFQINFNPQFLAQSRQKRNQSNLTRNIAAVVLDKDSASELNPNTLAEHQHRHTQKDRADEVAEEFLTNAWIHYGIMRDCYIANVLAQVIERHFINGINHILQRKFSDEEFKALVMIDRKLEEKKTQLQAKTKVLKECWSILEPYRLG